MAGFRAIALGAVLGQIAALPTTAQQQIDLFGVTSATLEWSPASGPVSGYYVIVARNGGTPALQGVAAGTRATVASAYGDNVQVQVAAFDAAGVAGPVSPASSTIVFNPPPQSPPPADPEPVPDPDPTPEPEPTDPPDEPGSEAPGEVPAAAPARFDFTGDGVSDLLLRDSRSGKLALWEMRNSQVTRTTSIAHLPYPWKLEESGDYDGDGTADLLWRNSRTGQLVVWLIRNGAVSSGAGLDLADLRRAWSIATRGDFDGDGKDDIVLARPRRGTVDILHMDGAKVASRVAHSAPSDRWRVIAAPDADGDGVAEIVWENVDSHALSIEWMSAPGQFAPLVSKPGKWRVVGAGDLDGDGFDDLLVREPDTGLVKPWLLDEARVVEGGWIARTGRSYRGLGDFNGDRMADSFWTDAEGRIEIWHSTEGDFEPVMVPATTGGKLLVGEQGD
jgi:hypothetical protein